MQQLKLVRDYENLSLPLEQRVPSLARRFPCLRNAEGLTPFESDAFYAWLRSERVGSPAWHAGHLILNLLGDGPWAPFDAIGALQSFDEADRVVFANWVRCWQ